MHSPEIKDLKIYIGHFLNLPDLQLFEILAKCFFSSQCSPLCSESDGCGVAGVWASWSRAEPSLRSQDVVKCSQKREEPQRNQTMTEHSSFHLEISSLAARKFEPHTQGVFATGARQINMCTADR